MNFSYVISNVERFSLQLGHEFTIPIMRTNPVYLHYTFHRLFFFYQIEFEGGGEEEEILCARGSIFIKLKRVPGAADVAIGGQMHFRVRTLAVCERS